MLNIVEWSKGISKHEFAACFERLDRSSAEEFFLLTGREALLSPGKGHYSLLLKAVGLYVCIMGQQNDKKTSERSVLQPARKACEVHAVYDEVWQLYKNVICSQKNPT